MAILGLARYRGRHRLTSSRRAPRLCAVVLGPCDHRFRGVVMLWLLSSTPTARYVALGFAAPRYRWSAWGRSCAGA
ncbi:hypothetical protein STVIR_3907 [Streptomyces viridochromogenes Tue57]|uniref:Uncharacterized protein n=1 Tax=Streptomyces viridochromogenes Tue57 TaxID=1160705 RepID=L8PCE5_STRVR|nr:hypothetical protein STVIR_3907 [Streptomyces viridochromogenes Tue57]